MKITEKLKFKGNGIFWCLAGIFLTGALPLLTNYCLNSSEVPYQLVRIENMKDYLSAGIFQMAMPVNWQYEHGTAGLDGNLFWLLPVVWCAPIIGDQCNYWIGHFFGRRIIESGKVKAMTPERIEKTEKMIEKWGPLAVFLGRFFPFIRTFMPFISGISGMRWSRFTPFSVLGGLCWSTLFTLLGYFFGGIPAVQKHFELVIIAILVLSLIPTIIGLLKAKFGKKKPAAEDTAETADAE